MTLGKAVLKRKSKLCNSVCDMRGSREYLRDEVGVRHEQLLQDVHDCKNGSQLVLESRFGVSHSRWALLASTAGAADFAVEAGSAGLRVW